MSHSRRNALAVAAGLALVASVVAGVGIEGCAKVSPGNPDMTSVDAAGRERDLAGADLIQIEEHDLGLCGDCDDQIACTIDVCRPTGTCDHVPDHGKCGARQLCTMAGCIALDTSKLCAACTVDAECGVDEFCTALPSGDLGTRLFCLPRCGAGAACLKGFSCDVSRSRCVPDSDLGLCCFDGDGDGRGFGGGCLGSDCDDANPDVYAGHPEVCDGKDNDCNGQTDEGSLCGGPMCGPIGTTGAFSGTPVPACTAGHCDLASASSCGKYGCQPVTMPVTGTACRTACSGVDDTACIATAYCDGAACTTQLPAGSACARDRVCQSGHCQNGHCCGAGDCCAAAGDCPAGAYATPPVCDAPPASCQGHREDPTCTAQKACAKLRVDDDSACGASISIGCAPASPQACTGAVAQSPLVCPTTCMDDSGCVASAYCSASTCVARKPDGTACGGDNQCLSGHHCLNGFCCNAASGACCGVAADCPGAFAAPSTCDSPVTSCQGHRVDRSCVNSICGSQNTDDDTACSSSIGKSCGAYDPVSCTGLATQSPLVCPASCQGDGDCVQPQNHCLNGTCQPWIENGGACTATTQCRSGFCAGSTCCQSACNGTACDSCGGGACNPFVDPLEAGNQCLPSLPDLGTGAFTATVQAYLASATDTDDWYQLYASDAANGCGGFLKVSLGVPTGVDYDVFLYGTPDGSCGATQLLGAGTNSSGDELVRWTERCGVSDEGWYLVQVHRYSGQSCTLPYTLTVDARL